jgi:DNA helicase-2/ATP-dependent DNA helicase PcrA
MEFNADGSLKVTKKVSRDHIVIFHLISELPFLVGKQLLIKILRGETTKQIKQHGLDKLVHHGSLGGYEPDELFRFIDVMIQKGFLVVELQKGTYSVVNLSPLGFEELSAQKHSYKVDDASALHHSAHTLPEEYKIASITEQDKKIFSELDFFLHEFTDEQKKAIICMDARQACIAGAGSGKTSVLTHKIVFLVKYANILPKDILAITFTRKARQEMMQRLASLLPGSTIRVETFNSFAEQEIKKHAQTLYGREKQMVGNKEFLSLLIEQLAVLGFTMDRFLDHYFSPKERRSKEQRQLLFSFLYDFRSILDAFILHGREESFFEQRLKAAKLSERITAQNVAKLVYLVSNELRKRGLRTYADQLVDCNNLYAEHPSCKRFFSWVLVDEYQDVNSEQIALLEQLAPSHLFVVGDPRQSIYAWRGANPQTMYDFIRHSPTTIIELTTNFRSTKRIITFANALIDQTNNGKHVFSSLQAHTSSEGAVSLERFSSDVLEAKAIVTKIRALQIPRSEIFVLSRTNKGLQAIADACKEIGILFVTRTEEGVEELRDDAIVLATVHAIKGLEATVVFVVGASAVNYPCRAKDHHFVELLVGKESYDVYEEERRILYVAVTRAKQVLHISHVGVPSPFLHSKVLHSTDVEQTNLSAITIPSTGNRVAKQKAALRRWRFLESKERNIPAYLIFSDKVLEQLLALQPLTLEDLHAVPGLSKSKIDELGLDILHVLQAS